MGEKTVPSISFQEMMHNFEKYTPESIINKTYQFKLIQEEKGGSKLLVGVSPKDDPSIEYTNTFKIPNIADFDIHSSSEDIKDLEKLLRDVYKKEHLWASLYAYINGQRVGKNLFKVFKRLDIKIEKETGHKQSQETLPHSNRLKKFAELSPDAIINGKFRIEPLETGSIKVHVWAGDKDDGLIYEILKPFKDPVRDFGSTRISSEKDVRYALGKVRNMTQLWFTVYHYQQGERVGYNAKKLFETLWGGKEKEVVIDPSSIKFDLDAISFDPEAYGYYDDGGYDGSEGGYYQPSQEYEYYQPTQPYQGDYYYPQGRNDFDDGMDDYEDEILKQIEAMHVHVDDYIYPCEECGKIPSIENVGLCKDCCYKKK